MKLPKIDLKELEEFKKQNFKERLEFIKFYAQWVKRTSNVKWSFAQKKLIDQERSDPK